MSDRLNDAIKNLAWKTNPSGATVYIVSNIYCIITCMFKVNNRKLEQIMKYVQG